MVFFYPLLEKKKKKETEKRKFSLSLYISIFVFSSYEPNKPVSLRQTDSWTWLSRKFSQHPWKLDQGSFVAGLYPLCLHRRNMLQNMVYPSLGEVV